eukprot:Amastigsp_a677121_17.p3 type:complete len:162 gc:universal Amastigsp_a677121_17:182-667(+)
MRMAATPPNCRRSRLNACHRGRQRDGCVAVASTRSKSPVENSTARVGVPPCVAPAKVTSTMRRRERGSGGTRSEIGVQRPVESCAKTNSTWSTTNASRLASALRVIRKSECTNGSDRSDCDTKRPSTPIVNRSSPYASTACVCVVSAIAATGCAMNVSSGR